MQNFAECRAAEVHIGTREGRRHTVNCRGTEIHVVRHIECLGAELQRLIFANRERPRYTHIEANYPRP